MSRARRRRSGTLRAARRAARVGRRWLAARHELTWLVLLAFLVRAIAAVANPTIVNDSVRVLASAAAVRDGGLGAATGLPEHPLLPVLIAWVTRLAGDPMETVATAICVIAGSLAVWPLHVLSRRACGRHAATGACVLYAALPKAVGVSTVPLTSALLLPLFLGALALVAAAGAPAPTWRRNVRLVGAGVLGGLAYLARPEGLVAAVAAVLAASTQGRPRRRLAAGAMVAGAFVAVSLPYVIALSSDAGRLVLSPKKDVAVFADLGRPATVPGADPASFATALRETGSAIEGALTVPGLLLLALGAFPVVRWRHRHSRHPRVVLLATAAVLVAMVVRLAMGWGYASSRHVLPAAVVLLPFCGEGLLFLAGFLRRVSSRRRLVLALASCAAIPLAVRSVLRPEGERHVSERALGEAIAAQHPDGALTIASFARPLVAYYAGRDLAARGMSARDVGLWGRFRPLLAAEVGLEGRRRELAAHLRTKGAQWLVLDLFETGETREGELVRPERVLAEHLTRDGVLGTPVVSPGTELVAFPVR